MTTGAIPSDTANLPEITGDQVNDGPSLQLPPPGETVLELSGTASSTSDSQILGQSRRFFNGLVQQGSRLSSDGIQPSVQYFLQKCDSDPLVAVLVAAPLAISALIGLSFTIGSIISLLLWAAVTICVGASCIIIGGSISLLIKLSVILWRALPSSNRHPGQGTFQAGLQYLMNPSLWRSIMSSTSTAVQCSVEYLRTIDWAGTAQWLWKMCASMGDGKWGPFSGAIVKAYNAAFAVCCTLYSEVSKALAGNTSEQASWAARPVVALPAGEVQPSGGQSPSGAEERPVQPPLERDHEETMEEEVRDIVPIDISNSSNNERDEATRGLKQRAPFQRLDG
ncbi:hypothetical protein D9613_011020 [Agrocybe pediades]|uniref:Uncharacterized protein n=1 Tax=Agrocybe pediades TaxID=84607 RepID=A0A8H4QLU9_9AGAR|nr:hypothetical protein D9613_011020 [Agrocybe pediades]